MIYIMLILKNKTNIYVQDLPIDPFIYIQDSACCFLIKKTYKIQR